MRRVLMIGCWFVMVWMGLTPAFSQGLFESSQSGTNEKIVSNSPSLGGFFRSTAYIAELPDNSNHYLQSVYGQAGLLLSGRAGSWATGKAEIRFRYGNEFQQTVSEMEIREAYVDLSAGPVGLKAGKLISPWGKGTVFNPVEKMTPMDPTVRSPEEDDMYLGTWAMQGRVNLGSHLKFTGTWKPLYQSSKLLIDPVPMPEYVHFLEPEGPGVKLNEGSYGLNLGFHSRLIDLSLYWFDGHHHWPGLGFDSFVIDSAALKPAALNLREEAYRIQMAGADFSLPLGSWIIRGEGSWMQTVNSHMEMEYLPFPEFSYTAEIEKGISNTTLLAGYYGKYILDFTPQESEPSLTAGQEQFIQLFQTGIPITGELIDGMITDRVRGFNRMYNYQLEEIYHTVFLLWTGNFLYDRVEITLPVIYHITTKEWICQPEISYSPGDGIKISTGFNGMYGPDNSLYDMVGPVLNAGYLSLKLTF